MEGAVAGPPNTAIIVFHSDLASRNALHASRNETDGSFWKTGSIIAQPLKKTGTLRQFFLLEIIPRLRLELHVQSHGSNGDSRFLENQFRTFDSENSGPPLKRSRVEGLENTLDDTAATVSHASTSISSRESTAPDSPEWMRARIAQLEAEVDDAKAARDMAISEQEVTRTAHRAEQVARREAMSQKSAAEAALSRKEVEYSRLHAELESTLSQKLVLSGDVEKLRGELAAAKDKLEHLQLSSKESTNPDQRIKTLELELEEAQDRAHKLRIQNSSLESREVSSEATELGARSKIKGLESKLKQLESDLTSAQDQLASTQGLLESMERKYSMARRKRENTKVKLGLYKERLENERTVMKKLRDTLTPAAYQSLGATHEALGAFLSAMDLPPLVEDGNAVAKEESD